jgi:hypothetical protein
MARVELEQVPEIYPARVKAVDANPLSRHE